MIPYFAQKSLIASLLMIPARKILSIAVSEQWAIVAIRDQPYPTAIRLLELEMEHDRQRRERGRSLHIRGIEPETGETYFADSPDQWPASLHLTSLSECDCHDYQRQKAAGRDRPFCKHMAALRWRQEQIAAVATDGNRYREMSDHAVAAEAEIAYAELF